MARPRIPLEDRYIPEPNTGCWLWLGFADQDGYGKATVRDGSRRRTGAHRFFYEEFVGPIPGGLCVLHRCDTPACVNPEHLFLGIHSDNAHDRHAKGRTAALAGENASTARLRADDVMRMREMRRSGFLMKDIAKAFNISASHAASVSRGVFWKCIAVTAMWCWVGLAVAEDRHVYLDVNGNGQLNDCPNPLHSSKGAAGNTDELFYCVGGLSTVNGKIIGTVTGTVSRFECERDGGSYIILTNGALADVDRDGVVEWVYGHPQACVFNMAKSDSCEVHAGTYRRAGAQCTENCGDNSYMNDQPGCNGAKCWLASVIAWGFGPNLSGSGYGTEANPGYLRGAVMNSSTDTWDTNGDKVPDGSYSVVLSGDRDADAVFDETLCSGGSNCTGDIFHALIVGCGGGAATETDKWKANCPTNTLIDPDGAGTAYGQEEFVKVDTDANGTFDTEINPRVLGPGANPTVGNLFGYRNVDYFQVKDIEFTRYNQGNDNDKQDVKLRTGSINLNGDGSADGLILDHIYMHTNSYGASTSVENEHNQAHIDDMWNRGCATYTEIKNSYLEQNNRLLFADEGSAASALGCSWRIHDNRILVNVLSHKQDYIPFLGFFKAYDTHPDGRPKVIRFYNNEVMYLRASNTTNHGWMFQFGQFGRGTTGGPGQGEFWMYGNLIRNRSDNVSTLDNVYPNSCEVDCSGCCESWRVYSFNNTFDGYASTKAVSMDAWFRSNTTAALGELYVERNNVMVYTTDEVNTTYTPRATTVKYVLPADGTLPINIYNSNTNDGINRCSGTTSRYWDCGTNPIGGSGLLYYTPYPSGGLAAKGSCDPDGDGVAGFDNYDTSGNNTNITTWLDIAGHTVNCPTTGTAMEIGAIQIGAACTNTGCGDGCVGGAETCDDGNTTVAACAYGDDPPLTQVCDSDCIGNVNCSSPMYCGDGVINGSESCDGAQLGGMTCALLSQPAGTLLCAPVTCAFDTTGCTGATSSASGIKGGAGYGVKFP